MEQDSLFESESRCYKISQKSEIYFKKQIKMKQWCIDEGKLN